MNFDELKKKYQNDPEFYHLVNVQYKLLRDNNINISTLKEAAYLAALKFEEEQVRPMFLVTP